MPAKSRKKHLNFTSPQIALIISLIIVVTIIQTILLFDSSYAHALSTSSNNRNKITQKKHTNATTAPAEQLHKNHTYAFETINVTSPASPSSTLDLDRDDSTSPLNITTRGLFSFLKGSLSSSSTTNKPKLLDARNQEQQGGEQFGRDGDTRVPFWNIAHMINSIEQIIPALHAGSNGIEVDVSFDKRGFPVESYHGFPCDCGRHCHYREDFVKLVEYLGNITYPFGNSNLQLVLFDLKLKGLDDRQKEAAGSFLASILHDNLYSRISSLAPNGHPLHPPQSSPPSPGYYEDQFESRSSSRNSKQQQQQQQQQQHSNPTATNRHNRRDVNYHYNQPNQWSAGPSSSEYGQEWAPSPTHHPQYNGQPFDQQQKYHYQQPNRAPLSAITIRNPLRVIISINHAVDSILVKSFSNFLRQNRVEFMGKYVGFDVGMNDNLTDINEMWDSLNGETINIWQGDGLTNCANIVRGVQRLKEAISYRNGQGHFRKVYYWTADVMYHIRSVLRLGIDAILTNQPQRVNQVLNEPEFNGKYRLATPFDDPFAQYWIKPSAWKMSFPTISEAVETVENIKQTGANFVKTLPDGFSAVIKKVQNSISSIR